MSRQKVILDVDTGGDDAVALMLAGHHPRLELVGVTVVTGNAPLKTTLRNTLAALAAAELATVPVYSGAERPIIARPIPRDPVQEQVLPLPNPLQKPEAMQAVDFLVQYYMGSDGPDTVLVPVAPLTNVSLALLREPRLAERIPHLVMMGGAYTEGNVTPSAEFNIYADPEAAQVVFSSGVPITMVGLEVTAQALLSLEDAERIAAQGTPACQAAGQLIREDVQWFIDNLGWDGGQIYDACAVAAIIEPDILQTSPAYVEVELQGELTRGRTVVDFHYTFRNRQANTAVGTGIDRERFLHILSRGLMDEQ